MDKLAQISRELNNLSVRNTPYQKELFIRWAATAFNTYNPMLIDSKHILGFENNNLIFGNPEKCSTILYAFYDTPKKLLFPFFHFINNRMLNAVEYSIPLLMLLGMTVLLTMALKWNIIIAVMLFITAAIFVCSAYIKQNNESYNASLLTLFEISRLHPEICICLLDNRHLFINGRRLFRKKYRRILKDRTVIGIHPFSYEGQCVIKCSTDKHKYIPEYIYLLNRSIRKQEIDYYMAKNTKLGFGISNLKNEKDDIINYASIDSSVKLISQIIEKQEKEH